MLFVTCSLHDNPTFLSSIWETYICIYIFFLHARSAIAISISFIDVFHHEISWRFYVIDLLRTHANSQNFMQYISYAYDRYSNIYSYCIQEVPDIVTIYVVF